METREWSFIDKSQWHDGVWMSEPDKVQWCDAATGLPCLIVRQSIRGALCGYVGVSESHRWFGKAYGEIDCLDVHGGLTFANMCREDEKEHGICHIPEAGEPDHVWWFGFDCAHYGDYTPGHSLDFFLYEGVRYRDLAYVKDQCAYLASQLALAGDES